MPGYHLHFLTADRSAGGHLLGCRIKRGTAMLDETPRLLLSLPRGSGFRHADLNRDLRAEIEKAER